MLLSTRSWSHGRPAEALGAVIEPTSDLVVCSEDEMTLVTGRFDLSYQLSAVGYRPVSHHAKHERQ